MNILIILIGLIVIVQIIMFVKLGKSISKAYNWQIEILDKIQGLDINKIATANANILDSLDKSVSNLDGFFQSMTQMTEYLVAVRELNEKLDDHLERTQALIDIAAFYKTQMKDIEQRHEAIKTAVLSVDDVLRGALASLKANSEQGLKSMQETLVVQMSAMEKAAAQLPDKLTAPGSLPPQVIKSLQEMPAISAKLDKIIECMGKTVTSPQL